MIHEYLRGNDWEKTKISNRTLFSILDHNPFLDKGENEGKYHTIHKS